MEASNKKKNADSKVSKGADSKVSKGDDAKVIKGEMRALQAVGQLKHRKKQRKKKLSKFERRYTALGTYLKPEQKRIDFILVQKIEKLEDENDEEEKEKYQRKEELRQRFEKAMRKEGFSIKEDIIDGCIYKQLHCPFKRLCKEAERVKLEMPLKGCEKYPQERTNCITEFIENHLETDNEVDFISAPFKMNKIEMFENYENPTIFFRPALRSFLTYHILQNIDVRDKSKLTEKITEKVEGDKTIQSDNILEYQIKVMENCVTDFCGCCPCYPKDSENPDNIILSKMGLPYMLVKGVYIDSFVLHEDSALSKLNEEQDTAISKEKARQEAEELKGKLLIDPRKELDETWTKFWKFQPVWKIRNYFGEKIALYFAWVGMLITSLWIPMFFGLACFIYGVVVSISRRSDTEEMPKNLTVTQEIKWQLGQLYNTVSGSFDNDVTPYFALVVCLWGTVFLEMWKRHNARLAYEWDVDQFEQNEPDRPEFFGNKLKKDPVTQEHDWFYSWKRQIVKFFISASTLIFMICLVFISVAAVVVYRVIVSVDYCTKLTPAECLVTSTIISALLNAVSILILGRIYDMIAFKLTEWENHRTQTQYNDALIIKLFAFSFANSYASCFYIAFFRGRFGGIFGLSEEYNDACEGNSCMSQLSFQVLILMLTKPLPKFLKDIVLPFIKRLFRNRPGCCHCNGCCCCNNKISDEEKEIFKEDEDTASMKRSKMFLLKERYKPELGDFTLGEYTEKVILYGFLMLFTASFPLAPLIAITIMFLDKHIDAKRLLWLNRRPVAFIAQDLGMWYGILNFINLVGVITNGFLIAFTSGWGLKYSIHTRLWICIAFEHIVFALKFILAYLIPDVPKDVQLAIRREKYQVAKKFEDRSKPLDYSELIPAATYDERARHNSANYRHFTDEEDSDNVENKAPPAPWSAERARKTSKEDLPVVTEENEESYKSPSHKKDVASPRHDETSLGAVNPEGTLLHSTQDLASSGTKAKLDGTETLDSVRSVNFIPSNPPPPPPQYLSDHLDDNSDDTDTGVTIPVRQLNGGAVKGTWAEPRTGATGAKETKC